MSPLIYNFYEKFNRRVDLTILTIFDLDGTLADSSAREQFPKYYDENFNNLVLKDLPIQENIKEIKKTTNSKVMILTGRKSLIRRTTKQWLKKNEINYHYLVMRSKSCNESNTNFKLDIVRKLIKKKFKITKIYDDNFEFLNKAKVLIKNHIS